MNSSRNWQQPAWLIPTSILFALGALSGAALSRVLYEMLFPRAIWLNRPVPPLLISLLLATICVTLAQKMLAKHPTNYLVIFAPLALNGLVLADLGGDPLRGALYVGAALWGTLLLAAHLLYTPQKPAHGTRLDLALITLLLLPIYLLTMGQTVGAADTFEFQVTIPKLGVVHPTGYPLYLLLGRVFTLLPFGSVAWRVNFATVCFGIVALWFIYLLIRQISSSRLGGIAGAVALGLATPFWRQAIEAEVYTLHLLVVSVGLWLMVRLLDKQTLALRDWALLAGWVGLGLTNHLTTVFLLPPAGITFLYIAIPAWRARQTKRPPYFNIAWWGKLSAAFAAPLLLYAYLPLRWQAVNQEPMGLTRFIDWVVGGRFQAALQWGAWYNDLTRYTTVGRLFTSAWPASLLILASIFFLFLFIRDRQRPAVLLAVTWLGFTFYCLNYYVPDLTVFLLPAQLLIAVVVGCGIGLLDVEQHGKSMQLVGATLLLLGVLIVDAPATWRVVDQSQSDGLLTWGNGVLNQSLPTNSVILADSEKIAPLYYLQQAEGVRPDLDIAVLFTEDEYRNKLFAELGAGNAVYLARFLPGLEGSFHLHSAGPLTAVGTTPMMQLPAGATATQLSFSDIQLAGLSLEERAAIDPSAVAATFYWRAPTGVADALHIYTRWAQLDGLPLAGYPAQAGVHPANDTYPTQAWHADEIVTDFHLLPRPLVNQTTRLALQVAWAPPFTNAAELAWQSVTEITIAPTTELATVQPLHVQLGDTLLTGIQFPSTARPESDIPLVLTGCGTPPTAATFALESISLADSQETTVSEPPRCGSGNGPFVWATTLPAGSTNNTLALSVSGEDSTSCGWLQLADSCQLATIQISGAPPGVTNFDDAIALLGVTLPEKTLTPGGSLLVELDWQALRSLDADYTMFLQVLDENDQIVGQVDTYPLQGTFPTSEWQVGEQVDDIVEIQLAGALPAGNYRLIFGWYLLGTPVRRLPLLDDSGLPIDDKLTVPGLTVP